MFYQFGLFSLRRFAPPPSLLQSQARREILSRRAPTHSLQFKISPTARTITTSIGQAASRFNSTQIVSLKGVVLTGCVGLGLAMSLTRRPVHCDVYKESVAPRTASKPVEPLAAVPQSEVNYYELSFGTIAGVCTGIFVKKGAKLAATLLGGIFVLLQYFHSMSFIHIDWSGIGRGFNNAIRIEDEDGTSHPPTILSAWSWLIDFLTADFQPRASFLAGFVLGLRLG